MALNPTASAFTPKLCPADTEAKAINDEYLQRLKYTRRKHQYNIYQDKRRAAIHTIIRAGYESAQIDAGHEERVHAHNVKDKLIVDLVRLLAGLGWPTGTVLRAVTLLEMKPVQDSLECLQEAKRMTEEYHRQRESVCTCVNINEHGSEHDHEDFVVHEQGGSGVEHPSPMNVA